MTEEEQMRNAIAKDPCRMWTACTKHTPSPFKVAAWLEQYPPKKISNAIALMAAKHKAKKMEPDHQECYVFARLRDGWA